MTETTKHTAFLREAIRLSREGLDSPHGRPFGAIVARDGEAIGRGFNKVIVNHDPTAHAEIIAIRDACQRLGNYRIDGAILYSSCEPCPMCLIACFWAGISTIIYGCSTDDSQSFGFEDKSYYRQIRLPREERSISSFQMLRDEAIEIMSYYDRVINAEQ